MPNEESSAGESGEGRQTFGSETWKESRRDIYKGCLKEAGSD